MASDEQTTAFDSKRRLCPDGSCIGVIGSDGRCSVCGRSIGEGRSEVEADADPQSAEAAPLDHEEDGEPEARAEPGATFDPHRRLCSDGTCIGVIGKDNRCQVCGRPA